jgi:hypothetical protein
MEGDFKGDKGPYNLAERLLDVAVTGSEPLLKYPESKQLGSAPVPSLRRSDVCCWPKADITVTMTNVRYRMNSGHHKT